MMFLLSCFYTAAAEVVEATVGLYCVLVLNFPRRFAAPHQHSVFTRVKTTAALDLFSFVPACVRKSEMLNFLCNRLTARSVVKIGNNYYTGHDVKKCTKQAPLVALADEVDFMSNQN